MLDLLVFYVCHFSRTVWFIHSSLYALFSIYIEIKYLQKIMNRCVLNITLIYLTNIYWVSNTYTRNYSKCLGYIKKQIVKNSCLPENYHLVKVEHHLFLCRNTCVSLQTEICTFIYVKGFTQENDEKVF